MSISTLMQQLSADELLPILLDVAVKGVAILCVTIVMARPSALEGGLLAILEVTRNRRTLTWIAGLLIGIFAVPLTLVLAENGKPAQSSSSPLPATQPATQSAINAKTSRILEELSSDPVPITTDAELDAVIGQLQVSTTRLGALRRLIACGRFNLYQVGSVSFVEGDAEQDRRANRAAEVARAAADLPTITAALAANDRALCFYGVWFYRSLAPPQQQELLPRIKDLAVTGDAGIRARIVQILAARGDFRQFLAERVEQDSDLSVIMHLVYRGERLGYELAMNRVADRLLRDADSAVRQGALSFIAFTPQMAEMWQVRYDRAVLGRILELTGSKDIGERSGSAAALSSVETAGPDATRAALLRLTTDPEPRVRWNAIHSLRAHRADADVQAAIQKCLNDPVPVVVEFAVIADGVDRHRAEIEILSKCDDPQVAEFAHRWLDHWNTHPASDPATQPATPSATQPVRQ